MTAASGTSAARRSRRARSSSRRRRSCSRPLGGRLLGRTRFGRALEAIAQDFDAAVLVGLPVKRLVGIAFALAGVWASLAAVLAAPSAAFDPDTAARYGLYGLLAAAVTWFDARRALVAGLVLGLVQATITSAHWSGGPGVPRRDPARARAAAARLAHPRAGRGGRMTAAALGEAARELRRRLAPALVALRSAAFAVAALAPLVVGDARTADLAAGCYLACAAIGLAFVVGVAGLPSLAQGGLVAIGAIVGAHLLEHGVPTVVAAVAAGARRLPRGRADRARLRDGCRAPASPQRPGSSPG